MFIRTPEQLSRLSQVDQETWRSNAMTQIIQFLAKNFSVSDLAITQQMSMQIMRAACRPNEFEYLQESAGGALENQIAVQMAGHLRDAFLSIELVQMDGNYSMIFKRP